MLVWLASYPRSGNTLLRQVLKSCFDLNSCEGLEQVPEQFRVPDGVRDEFYGSYFLDGEPAEFYQQARASAELVLIKSHQLPRDGAKAIYVVRDGRLALKSYVKYQDTYHAGTSSFESLLLGDNAYGEWASHYRAWAARGGETLAIRFEELVNAGPELLARIGAFLGVGGPVRPWVNPKETLRARDPAFFGTGHTAWAPDPFWTEARLRQFYTLHGALVAELGYATADEVRAGAYPADSDEARLLHFAHALVARRDALQAECDARAEALARTKAMADASIAELEAVCAERERAIYEQDRRAQEQARHAQEHLAAAAARIRDLDTRRAWWRRLPLYGTLRRLVRR
jgi:hypothetical protein